MSSLSQSKFMTFSFIESPFCSKVEYEAWLKLPAEEQQAALDAKGVDSLTEAAESLAVSEDAAPQLLQARAPYCTMSMRSSEAKCAMVVGLTGCSRSGKSWIAGEVQRTLDAQGKKSSVVVGQDSFWVQSVMVKVGAQMRSSEEDPDCTDNEAFERAIRHEMLLHDVVIAEGFQVRRCAEPFSLRPLPAAERVWQRDALACHAPTHASVTSTPRAHAQATVL